MNILIVGPEAAPFCRTGGLGDVLSALPQALQKQGHDVRLVLPGYEEVDFTSFKPRQKLPPASIWCENIFQAIH